MITSDQFVLFSNFAKYWQDFAHGHLLLLSSQGEVLSGATGDSPINWQTLLKQLTNQHEPIFLKLPQNNILAISLAENGQNYGYLVIVDAQERDAPLLVCTKDAIARNLANEQALQAMTDELIGAWNQLELVFRVTQNLTVTSDLMATLRSIIQETQRVIECEDGFILLRSDQGFTCVTSQDQNMAYDETLLDNLLKSSGVVVGNKNSACEAIWAAAPKSVNSLLATSLEVVDEQAQAAIGLINKLNHHFTAGDTKLLAALAQQVAVIIKNFLIHNKVIAQERLSREREIAVEIQESFLPTKLPEVGGVSVAVSSMPASEVGGDFYDFITTDDRYLTLVIGDVSGKGIPAAMLTSITRTMLRVEAMRGEPPHKIIEQAHHVLHQDLSRTDSFVTAFVANVDTLEGKLTYASAGHTPTLVYRAETKTVEQLKATSLPIGAFGYQESQPVTVALNPGDTLVFYTNGIIKAQSPNNGIFGFERLIEIVTANAAEPPEALQQRIQAELHDFYRSDPKDDTTLLIVKMLPYADGDSPRSAPLLINTLDFLYPADIDYLNEISRQISSACRELPSLPGGSRGDDFIYLIELAISEICTNIIKHAYNGKKGEISGQLRLLDNGIELDFYDQGEGFDPSTVPTPKTNPNELVEGGYGLHIIRQIMDVVSYNTQPGRGNHWHLIKYLPD
ncbi:MAG TPA: SpoIIE family protein phosphatase [Anaerolineae bacterium]|nr:SpoIIE family protein phosphatase [Anaerolineae bacterium]MCB0222099.1 SpoIIE family protein phosphatase [Anaerolineae bacterium]HRV90978.1 SpoIIE family protein phosphatase [Anaerolineae bacterium]